MIAIAEISARDLLVPLVAAPLIGALLCVFLKRRASDYVAAIFATITLVLAAGAIGNLFSDLDATHRVPLGWLVNIAGESRPAPLVFELSIDALGALMLFVVTVIGFLVVIYSSEYLSPRNVEHPVANGKGRYYAWLLLFVGAMVGIALAGNFFQLFIFWEITTLCSWALISYYQDEASLRAGFKALIMTAIGGLFFVLALVLMYLNLDTDPFAFDALGRLAPGLRSLVFVFLLVAAWAKAAQFPFFTWLPDAMAAPTPISCYLHAAAMVKAGVYLIARVVSASYGLSYGVGLLTGIMALATIFIVVFLFLFQDDLKKILALSTISHLGYILIGCALGAWGSATAFQGGLLHIAAHGCGKGLLFLSVGMITYFTGTRRISELSGVGRRLPIVAVGFFVGAFTVTGVPPLAGFWSKFLILTGGLELGGFAAVIAILLLIESMIAFGFFLWVGQRVFFGSPSFDAPPAKAVAWPMTTAVIILAVLCLVVTLFALPVIQHIPLGM